MSRVAPAEDARRLEIHARAGSDVIAAQIAGMSFTGWMRWRRSRGLPPPGAPRALDESTRVKLSPPTCHGQQMVAAVAANGPAWRCRLCGTTERRESRARGEGESRARGGFAKLADSKIGRRAGAGQVREQKRGAHDTSAEGAAATRGRSASGTKDLSVRAFWREIPREDGG